MTNAISIPIASHIHREPSPTLRLNERVKQLWAQGETVYHFGFGESRFPVHEKLQAALQANSHRKGYLPVQGLPDLREAIARYYSRTLQADFSAEQLIVAPGSKPLLFALLMALEGDVLLPTPSWVSYGPQARLVGKSVWQIPASPEQRYALTVQAVVETAQQSTSPTKIMVINSPNNPTGLMFEPDFLQALAEVCRQQNIIVMSDEIYGFVPHGALPHVSLAHYYPEGTIVVGGLSKHLSLGGWRLGHAIVPASQPHLMQALISLASEIWSSASAPIQYAALTAYSGEAGLEAYIAECTALHTIRSQHIWSWLHELGIRCPQPQGGFYMMPDFNRWREPLAQRGVKTSADLTRFLLNDYRLAALPGTAFGLPPEQLAIRLSTSYIDLETDEQAESMLARWREHGDKTRLMEQVHPTLGRAIAQFERLVEELG